MTVKQLSDSLAQSFTPAQMHRLREMQIGYRLNLDMFSEREKVQLGFVRWLYQNGRMES
ncbi:MAG: hypothetical protein NVS2B16_17540 [Chloroflexota bacterium]